MASDRSRLVARIPLTKGEGHFMEVEVAHGLGGWNHWHGRQEPAGYWVHVKPVEIETRDGWTSVRYGLFDGVRLFYREAGRMSAKTLDKLRDELRAVVESSADESEVWACIRHVCDKCGVSLAR